MSAEQPTNDGGSATGGRLEPFDLTVNLGPDSIPWLSATSRAGSVHGIPRRGPSLPRLPDLLDMVYDYTDAVQIAEPQPDPELSHVLGELVFGDPMVLQLFQATRGVAADRGRQVLVRILASPHLAVLPWELLPDPAAGGDSGGYRFLALAPDTYLVRLARGRTYPTRTTPLQVPLNLLIVLSSPTPEHDSGDLETFDIFEVKRALLAELSPLEKAGMLRIDVEDRPTLDNLRSRISAQRRGYHLFHYVGHALPGQLVLEDYTSRRRDVTSSQLVEVLRLCPDLRLAVFAGCQTARPAHDPEALDVRTATGWRDLLSLADCFVQEACPAVIGMQAVLPFTTERTLTRFFYQALANGYSTAEALRMARGAIRGDERLGGGLLDWSVPALFVGSTEPGALVRRSADVPKPVMHTRADLKLGLRQSDERFFGREVPLRQAVEFLKGLAPGRVLVVTGTAGVGKTCLVDRALDELGEVIREEDLDDAVTHVLYVHFERLAPEVAQAWAALDAGTMPDLAGLAKLEADDVLKRLCGFAADLLWPGGGTARTKPDHWSTAYWWDHIVDHLVQHRFVLAIDEVCLLDRVERGLLERLMGCLLSESFQVEWETASTEQRQAHLEVLMQRLAALKQQGQQGENESPSLEQQLAPVPEDVLEELRRPPDTLPDRLLLESRNVYEQLFERAVVALNYEVALGEPAAGAGRVGPLPQVTGPADIKGALTKLEAVRAALDDRLRVLADRRSPARIVLTAVERPRRFLDLPEGLVFEMRLAHLTWPETWRWIRRSLPGLTRFGEQYLSRLWPLFGARPGRWEELEGRVLRDLDPSVDLQALATKIAPRRPAQPSGGGALTVRRNQRALRIAVAGPNLAGPDEMAESLTLLAIEHGVGGHVVPRADEAGALATLIDEPTPFVDAKITEKKIMLWLASVLAQQPDIVLLDYGRPVPVMEMDEYVGRARDRTLLRSMHYLCLLIAAGGHQTKDGSTMIWVPGGYPEVLSVGPLDNEGRLREYAVWDPDRKKPDLFMADDLSRTALAMALEPDQLSFQESQQVWGSSFSALHAVAAATLVWAILPDLSPRSIRDWLVQVASNPIAGMKPARSLSIKDAVALARRHAVERTLKGGPASLQTLGATTGLEARTLLATLEALEREGTVGRLTSGRLEQFQLLV